MAAVPSVAFPFKGSDNNTYSAQTVPVDANGAVPGSAADGAHVSTGAKGDAAYTDATVAAPGSVIALLKGLYRFFVQRLDTNANLKTVLYDATGAAVTYGGTTAVQGVAGGVAVPVSGALSQAGSVGTDTSANAPVIPNVGAAFAASGPYAGYVLVRTIPASASRLNVDVENSSGGPIVLVRDDGTAASGTAPANATLIPLAGGQGSGQQGGSWTSTTFKGRLQIYAPAAGVFVSAAID